MYFQAGLGLFGFSIIADRGSEPEAKTSPFAVSAGFVYWPHAASWRHRWWSSVLHRVGARPALAAADERDDVTVMKDAIQDGGGDRHILEELAPLFERPV